MSWSSKQLGVGRESNPEQTDCSGPSHLSFAVLIGRLLLENDKMT